MLADLTGRVALVTGGGRGIGRGISLALAEQGADIAVADLIESNAADVAEEVRQHGRRAAAMAMDVTDRSSVEAAVASTLNELGKIDILVNNAGIVGAGGMWERDSSSDEDWDDTFQVNVRGIVRVTEAVQDHMVQRGSGRIINIASIAGRQGSPDIPHYSTSKAAVISWTQSNAQQLARHRINVNAICPGLLWTPMWEAIAQRRSRLGSTQTHTEVQGMPGRELFETVVDQTMPMKREQTPEDIGKLAAFLASDDAKNITGQAINVDGGMRMN